MLCAFFQTAQDPAERIRGLRAADRSVALDHERWCGGKSICPGHTCGGLKTGQVGASLKRPIQRRRIESHAPGQFQNHRSITDVPAFREKRPENSFVVGLIPAMFFGEFATLHRQTGIAHQRLRAEADAHFPSARVELREEGFRIHAREIVLPEDTLGWRVGMDFKRQPFIADRGFAFQGFDNTFADIAERSDIVGIDRDADGFHSSFSILLGFRRRGALYMQGNIIYIDNNSSTY